MLGDLKWWVKYVLLKDNVGTALLQYSLGGYFHPPPHLLGLPTYGVHLYVLEKEILHTLEEQ